MVVRLTRKKQLLDQRQFVCNFTGMQRLRTRIAWPVALVCGVLAVLGPLLPATRVQAGSDSGSFTPEEWRKLDAGDLTGTSGAQTASALSAKDRDRARGRFAAKSVASSVLAYGCGLNDVCSLPTNDVRHRHHIAETATGGD